MPLYVKKTPQSVAISNAAGKLCGTYHYVDMFKSFFRGLFTPSGKDVVACPPPEHLHHKGLQFGLTTSAANFWEEDEANEPAGNPPLTIGKQQTRKLDLLPGGVIGFTQDVWWGTDTQTILNETRTISVQEQPSSYVWNWRTKLTAAAPVKIVRSVWGAPGYCQPDFGYCGLGLRLAPDLFQNAAVVPPQKCGSTPAGVSFRGNGAAVTFMQDVSQANALFVSTYQNTYPYGPGGPGFAYMTLVPTPRDLNSGESLELNYIITVSDI